MPQTQTYTREELVACTAAAPGWRVVSVLPDGPGPEAPWRLYADVVAVWVTVRRRRCSFATEAPLPGLDGEPDDIVEGWTALDLRDGASSAADPSFLGYAEPGYVVRDGDAFVREAEARRAARRRGCGAA